MLQKLLCFIINLIEASFNYIILWFHVLYSHIYIFLCIEFDLDWVYLGVLHHDPGFNNNPVIKLICKYHRSYIISETDELSRPYYCVLDGPGISSKRQHSRQIHSCIGIFLCLLYYFRINIHVTSILHFIYLYCISVIPGIFIHIVLVRLLYVLDGSSLASFSITFWQYICSLFCLGEI